MVCGRPGQAYNGIDGPIQFSRKDLAHTPVVLLVAEETMDEDNGSIRGRLWPLGGIIVVCETQTVSWRGS